MCEYTPCPCLLPKLKKRKKFSVLLLDCWQREYDARPYTKFMFKRLDFEERMGRAFHSTKDFRIVVKFLLKRVRIRTLTLTAVHIVNRDPALLQDFAASLIKMRRISLLRMELPSEFFVMIRLNVRLMKIVFLNLEGTPLKDQDVDMLREFLISSRTLRTLNVNHCSITQYNFARLADGIHKSISIRSFNCSHLLGVTLTLDTEKIAHTVSSLIWQNKLTEIIMRHCEFVAQDIEIIAENLYRRDSQLKNLDLSYNMIGPNGVDYILLAASKSCTLIHLSLCGCNLGTHGGEIVAKYQSSCANLQCLYLTYNNIGAEAINLILTTMKKSIKLRYLHLYGNHYNSKTAKILRRLLDSHVLPQNTIDITVTYDESIEDYRIIPYRK